MPIPTVPYSNASTESLPSGVDYQGTGRRWRDFLRKPFETHAGSRRIASSSSLADGADGNGDAGSGVGGREHVAATVKNSAGIDDHAGRMDFAGDNAFGLNLDAAFGEDDAIEAAGDDYAVAFDLAFDFSAFAKDDRLLGDDVAFDVAVNAERARKLQRAFKRHALIDEASPLFVRAVL
jgi:hypothetical protein